MQVLKRVELLVFERMIEFQRGTMQSQVAFVTSQLMKLIFKDAFLLLVFLAPIETLTDTVSSFFQTTLQLNLVLSIIGAFLLGGFLFLAVSQISILHQKFKFIIRLLIPWLDIFCLLAVAVNMQLLLANLENNIALAVLNIIALVAVSLVQVFHNLFHFTKEPRSNNLFKKREAQLVSFCNTLMLIFTYYLSAAYFPDHGLSKGQIIAFSMVQFLTSLVKLKQRVYLQYYLSPFSQRVSSLFYFVELYLGLIVVMIYLLELPLLSQNILLLVGSTTILSYSALNAFLERRNDWLCLSSASDLKDDDHAILYLDRLCALMSKVEGEQEDIIMVSLKKKHMLACKKPECYCQKEGSLGNFVREYIRGELQAIADLFHSSPTVLLSVLYFRMVIFKYYPQILAKLAAYASHFSLSLSQRYHCYCLTQYVARFIRKKNYEIDAVDSEYMFHLEELRVQIESLLRGEMEVRSKQWKYLARGMCRVGELEHSCNSSLDRMARLVRIFQQHKVTFRKSKEFNLLFLFYFLKVSFINNGKEVKENLKEIYFGYKEDQLQKLKQFKKFIYHKRSCVIQTIVDTKTMGLISAASRNVEEMFGFPANKILGLSINTLMPQFMADEHEIILAEWARSGTWRTIGKLKEIYCVHKEQYCFSALLYLKLYVKDSTLHFITNIFKLNDNDFLVLNPNMKIEGLGRRFLKLLGEPAKKIALDLLIQHNQDLLEQEEYVEGRLYRKVFLGVRGLEDEVDNYLERINMKFDPEERRAINLAFHQKLRATCQEKFFVQFSIKRYRMRNLGFVVVGLREARKIDRLQSINYLDRHPTFMHTVKSGEIEYEGIQSHDSSLDKDEDNKDLLIEQNANSSMASLTEKENYPLSKTIEKFLAFVDHPASIRDARLCNLTIVMAVLVVLLAVINCTSYLIYRGVLLEIRDIFLSSGAQNDVMQATEIGYGFVFSLRSQLLNQTNAIQFSSTLRSARLINSYVYSLKTDDFATLVSSTTDLTAKRKHMYLQGTAAWRMGNSHKVRMYQFLEGMYYMTMRIINELQELQKSNSTQIDYTMFNQLFANFPQMEYLNEAFNDQYGDITDGQHQLVQVLSIASMILFLLLSFAISFMLNRYFRFRFHQLVLSFNFLTFVPGHYFDKLKDYYSLLVTNVGEKDKLKDIDTNEEEAFQVDSYELFKYDPEKGSVASKIKFINYQAYYKWAFILAAFILVNSLNYLATSYVRNFLPLSQDIINQVTLLMDAENKLQEGYFDLRAAYSLNPNAYLNKTLFNRLSQSLNQTDITFSSLANQLTTIFKQSDPAFQGAFVNTLVNNVCSLTAPFLSTFENQKCVSELKMNLLDGGVLISVNFLQKNILQALNDLQQQYMLRNATAYNGDYFSQSSFTELDKMLVYVFKIYQQLNAAVFTAYAVTVEDTTGNFLGLTAAIIAFFMVAMLLWLNSIQAQKKALSYLYGHLLLVPFMILRANTRIVSCLKEAIEYIDL